MRLASVALVVRDYDEAIVWFIDKLGFTLAEDTPLNEDKRWVRVSPPGGGFDLLLAKAIDADQRGSIGNAGGGRVCFFLHSNDFWGDYQSMLSKNVSFSEEPRNEPYGWVVVFKDLYGNNWDLIGMHRDATSEETL